MGKHSDPNLEFLSLPMVVFTKHGEHMDGLYPLVNIFSLNALVQSSTALSMRRCTLDVNSLDVLHLCFC